MAKVRIVLDTPIYDGIALTFKAPCPCTAVDGLIVYYRDLTEETSEQKSATFEFKDAHNNTLTGIGNLFNEGAYVKVILDTTNSSAYIQNADTNGYLEDKFDKFFEYSIIRLNVNVTEGEKTIGSVNYVSFGKMYHIYGDITFTPNELEQDWETRIFTLNGIEPPTSDLRFAQCFEHTQGMTEEDMYTSNVVACATLATDGTLKLFETPAGEYTKSITLHLNLMYSVCRDVG